MLVGEETEEDLVKLIKETERNFVKEKVHLNDNQGSF